MKQLRSWRKMTWIAIAWTLACLGVGIAVAIWTSITSSSLTLGGVSARGSDLNARSFAIAGVWFIGMIPIALVWYQGTRARASALAVGGAAPGVVCSYCGARLWGAMRQGDEFACGACGRMTSGTTDADSVVRSAVVIRAYRAKSADAAGYVFQRDAAALAERGYYPTSQSWSQGSWGCGAFLVALLLAVFLIGILIFIYLIVVKPDGTLTVTYQRRDTAPALVAPAPIAAAAAPAADPDAATKVCPDCAETVQEAARICRYCRHEFVP